MGREESFLELLKIDTQKYRVIAVVGGGGKTSLIYRLNDELQAMGKKVIITTTTHMAYEARRPFTSGRNIEETDSLIAQYGYVVAAEREEGTGKIIALPPELLMTLRDHCDVLLIEADGARQMPLKVPESWEPAIPTIAELVISVVGLDCLGKPISETTHRMERTAEFLKKGLNAPVTAEDVIKIASSICGLFKNVEDRVYRVYLNKSDVLSESAPAEEILRGLEKQNTIAAYGSLKECSASIPQCGNDDGAA